MIERILSGRARFLTHLTGWALVYLIFIYWVSWIRPRPEAFLRGGINLGMMMIVFYINARWIVNRYWEKNRLRAGFLSTFLLLAGASYIRWYLELHLLKRGPLARQLNGNETLIFFVILVSFVLLLLFSTLYQFLENRYSLTLKHRELETRHVEAQLNYLKAQINPHFLFNTLNNIYAAALLQHPKTAEMTLRLSDLLRYVTYDAQAQQISLEKELAQIQAYLHLFQLRFEVPPVYSFAIEGKPDNHTIEPVLLLPLIENALKHGDWGYNMDALLEIQLKISDKQLDFLVRNSFDPANTEWESPGGLGLENIRRRIGLRYGESSRLITEINNKIFTAHISLVWKA